MILSADHLFEVIDQTWPAARRFEAGKWTLREGRGGGQRVSAATALGQVDCDDIDQAATAMREMGQTPLFMIRDGDAALDGALDAMGYAVVDTVTLYTLPIRQLTDVPIPRVTAFTIWEPLAIMAEIWEKGGVGPARLDVMARAKIKTGVLARWNEQPAGVAFAGVHENICMAHAVEVLPHQRRQGVAEWMMRAAAFWGQAQGAADMAVLCVDQNKGANALYRSLGFASAGGYHYRKLID
ncbi:MAG: GNAT family N-acetyltransferase [Sulfitobacter sp.]